MSTRVCLSCKEDIKGFVICPKCGGKTELLEAQDTQTEPFMDGTGISGGSTQLAMWCHLAPLLIGIISFLLAFVAIGFILILFAWVPPLIIKNRNSKDRNVVKNANEALNFQFFWLISSAVLLIVYFFIGVVTFGIGLVIGGIAGVVLIFPTLLFILISQIRATSTAAAGKDFQYPLVLFRLLKA